MVQRAAVQPVVLLRAGRLLAPGLLQAQRFLLVEVAERPEACLLEGQGRRAQEVSIMLV